MAVKEAVENIMFDVDYSTEIARGAYGTVFMATDTNTGYPVAFKRTTVKLSHPEYNDKISMFQ